MILTKQAGVVAIELKEFATKQQWFVQNIIKINEVEIFASKHMLKIFRSYCNIINWDSASH